MAPKRSKPSSSGSFDRSKFISVEAFTRYHTSLINQRPIPERGIEIPILPYKEINDMIHDRYWCQFCHQPDATVVPVVREFYANVVEHVDGVAFVRGAQWKTSHDEPVSFKRSVMKKELQVWLHFVAARLLSSTHISDVTKDRAVLIYAIVAHKSIDVGKVISHAILHTGRTKRDGIGFPSLITALCARAGVQWSDKEQLQQPKLPITMGILQRLEEFTQVAGSSS
ncbi:Uncharacterized protein TCM_024087 [Theobroma cacao]|uniref:Putative plant transposon protein domain-containing protein n=1 Tax=Theobroma cacao TaxID=3641 RepID=A0A061F2U9_THECC|nr:Uncharacterized protein TCM_024087 [Theobroma cacao]